MKFTSIILPIMLAMTVGLAGCDQMNKKANAEPVDDGIIEILPIADTNSSTKLDLYSKAYNAMMSGQAGLKPSFDSFVARIINSTKNDTIFLLSLDRPEYAIQLFRKGYSIDCGDMHELDKNVYEAIHAAEELTGRKERLEQYVNSKKADGIDSARVAYDSRQAKYEALFVALNRIEPLLFRYRKARLEERMALFKKSDNSLGFYTEQSLVRAQNLLVLFAGSNDAINDSNTYDRGDILLSGLEASLAEQRKAYEQARLNDVPQIENYPAVHRILQSMIGSYRDLRQNRALSDLSALNRKFYEAIEANNRVSMLSQ